LELRAGSEEGVSVTLVLGLYAVGAAAIALWLVVRFPSVGPRTVTTVVVAAIAAAVVLQLSLALIEPVAQHAPYGVATALMLVILPALTGMFWSLALMLRLLASLRP
jgi:MFS superfamily sulfate permease-like transporter